MKVLFVASECYPLVKTGGLADVVGALPLALGPLGVDARVLIPAFPGIAEQIKPTKVVARFGALWGGSARVLSGRTSDGLAVLALDAPHLYARAGGPYVGPDGHDWPDNHSRFAALSWVGAEIGTGVLADWRPSVVHLHDWQTGLTAAYLRRRVERPATLFTIHNLAFQGVFGWDVADALALSDDELRGIEYWGNLSMLKAGLQWSDDVSTVSPTYAREILTGTEGMGMEGVLQRRSGAPVGIVNGIDLAVWDPATDEHLVAPFRRYSSRRLANKAADKAALQAALGLDVDSSAPLFCVVSRLTHQKGLDLLLAVVPHLLARGAQLAVLGSGEGWMEDAFRAAAHRSPGRVSTIIGYDEPLSHRLQAGSDAIVVPSRFEPCGLTQLYGLRYGTLPVVARVGGLADTVIDANDAALHDGVATGFQFSPVDVAPLQMAVDRVCDLYGTPRWSQLQRRAMTQQVGWESAAAKYVELYDSAAR